MLDGACRRAQAGHAVAVRQYADVAGQPATAAGAKPDPFDLELRGFQYDVTLGDWPAVKAFLAKLPKDEGKAAYEQLDPGLRQPPGDAGQPADADADARCSRCKCRCK